MNNSKIRLFVFFSLFSIGSIAQVKPVLYGGMDYFRDTGFENKSYINFNIGVEVFQWKFFAPEIGFEHYFGIAEGKELLNPADPNARPPAKLDSRFTTDHFSLAPKIKIGNEEAAFVFIPQYNIGKIHSRGDYLIDSGDLYLLEDTQRFSESIAFWSFAAGIEGQFFDSEIIHFSLFLKYNTLNTTEILQKINFPNPGLRSTGGSTQGLGLGLRVYFDVISLFRRNRPS